MSNSVVIMCSPHRYRYEGWTFEDSSQKCSPWPLNKDGSLRARASRDFFKMYKKFSKLTNKEKAKYSLGGGCELINLPKVRRA